MVAKKRRVPIPPELATEVMFRSDLTCCVCRMPKISTQIHHINDDPSDNRFENLAVLCLQDHDQTQSNGGLGRKLNAYLIIRYRDDWLKIVQMKRDAEVLRYINEIHSGYRQQKNNDTSTSGMTKQLFRLAGELNEQAKLTWQIAAAKRVLTDITIEFNGALSRLVLTTKVPRSASETSEAIDELAEELIPIATRYSTQSYSIRSMDNARVGGLEVQLEIFTQIPRAQWPKVVLDSVQEKKCTVESRLNDLGGTQEFYSNVGTLKGETPRLDDVVQHMLDAMAQELSVRSSYEKLQQKLDALDAWKGN
jgi:hypothetical protein